jgi:hypothetical protein
MELPLCLARLKPSKLHRGGVGVFAIVPIKKDQIIFDINGLSQTEVPKSVVKNLPKAVQKMYTDFAMQQVQDNVHNAPCNFHDMGMYWYVCHSGKPNCVYVNSHGYIARRSIKPGEELSVDYREWDKDHHHVGDIKYKRK